MKPIIRWTLGNVSKFGFESIIESARLLPKIYPEFDYVICHNNLNEDQYKIIKKTGIDLYEQKEEEIDVPHIFDHQTTCEIKNHVWKLCPLRLRENTHEIWIDNDIIIWKRIKAIDEFLKKNVPIISSDWGRSYYGRFDKSVGDFNVCAGFFGLPPNYPFKEKIKKNCTQPLKDYDEQGLIAKIVTENELGFISIDVRILNLLGTYCPVYDSLKCNSISGAHFTRINCKTNKGWEAFKLATHPFPLIENEENWQP